MNNKTIKQLGFLILFFFVACEEVVELDPGVEEKLVVNCHFSPNQTFKVYVSKTLDPLTNLDTDFPVYLKDAEVRIFQEDNLICELINQEPSGQIDFYSNEECLASEEIEYTLRVKAPGLEEVFASDIIPAKTDILSYEMSELEVQLESDTIANFEFRVKLMLGEATHSPSYYLLNLNYERVPYQIVGTDTIVERTGEFDPLDMEPLDDHPVFIAHYDKKLKGLLFMRKETEPVELNFSVTTPRPVLLTKDLFEQVFANLKSLSPDYYQYHLQVSRQIAQGDSVFMEPVILADNINNGYGIFAAYQWTQDSLSIDYE